MEIVTNVARLRGAGKEKMCELREDAIYRYKLVSPSKPVVNLISSDDDFIEESDDGA